jgi:hypothetical protein
MGMVFAVFYTWILINSAIYPQLMLQTQLVTTSAADLTTGVNRVVIFGAILSALMALLSFTCVKNKKTVVSN